MSTQRILHFLKTCIWVVLMITTVVWTLVSSFPSSSSSNNHPSWNMKKCTQAFYSPFLPLYGHEEKNSKYFPLRKITFPLLAEFSCKIFPPFLMSSVMNGIVENSLFIVSALLLPASVIFTNSSQDSAACMLCKRNNYCSSGGQKIMEVLCFWQDRNFHCAVPIDFPTPHTNAADSHYFSTAKSIKPLDFQLVASFIDVQFCIFSDIPSLSLGKDNLCGVMCRFFFSFFSEEDGDRIDFN